MKNQIFESPLYSSRLSLSIFAFKIRNKSSFIAFLYLPEMEDPSERKDQRFFSNFSNVPGMYENSRLQYSRHILKALKYFSRQLASISMIVLRCFSKGDYKYSIN